MTRLRAKLFGNGEIAERASKIIQLSPETSAEQPAAICLPDEFNRVIRVSEYSVPAVESARLKAAVRRNLPTTAYELKDVVFAQGSIYFDGGYRILRPNSARPLLPQDVYFFPEAQVCTYSDTEQFFGHWLNDGLLLELLAAERGITALKFDHPQWLHEPGYRELLKLDVEKSNHARVGTCWLIDDRGNNDGKISRLTELRRRLRRPETKPGSKLVMLTRGKLGTSRQLVNEREIHEAIGRIGFEIVHPELLTPKEIVDALANAKLVVLVEGSAHSHCVLAMPPGATVLTIQPPARFTAYFKIYCDTVGIHWAYVVGDEAPGGFRLPLERLLRTIDEISRVLAIPGPR